MKLLLIALLFSCSVVMADADSHIEFNDKPGYFEYTITCPICKKCFKQIADGEGISCTVNNPHAETECIEQITIVPQLTIGDARTSDSSLEQLKYED